MLVARSREHAATVPQITSRAFEQLAARRLTAADELSDFTVVEIERVVQQEHGALTRRGALEHDEKTHRHVAPALELFPRRSERDGLGQAIAPALLPPPRRAVEL